MRSLNGRVAVVTGAASGIGLSLSEMFIAEGMKVVLSDIDERRLQEVSTRFADAGAPVAHIVCDTSVESQVNALAAFAIEHFGGAHVLCNNAGIAGMGEAWTDSMAVWERTIGVNLYGVIYGIRAFLPIMTAQGEGHIVNTASMAGLIAMPGAAPYNVTKHGVVALSESLYLELKAMGSPIEVSVLCPGWVKTRLMEHEDEAPMSPMASFIRDVAKSSIDNDGIPTSEVAQQVLDAIQRDQFWVLTHEDMKPAVTVRFDRAIHGVNPPGIGQ